MLSAFALAQLKSKKLWRRSLVGYSGRFIPGRSLVRIRSPLPYGSLAQLVRAPALQAGGHRFESCSFHQYTQYGPMVKRSKTSPFHGGNPSSNLGRVTKKHKYELVLFSLPKIGRSTTKKPECFGLLGFVVIKIISFLQVRRSNARLHPIQGKGL